jgi:hypothetical protein
MAVSGPNAPPLIYMTPRRQYMPPVHLYICSAFLKSTYGCIYARDGDGGTSIWSPSALFIDFNTQRAVSALLGSSTRVQPSCTTYFGFSTHCWGTSFLILPNAPPVMNSNQMPSHIFYRPLYMCNCSIPHISSLSWRDCYGGITF